MTRRPLIGVGAVAVVVTIALVFTLASAPPPGPGASPTPDGAVASGQGGQGGGSLPPPTAPPVPGHELFGFVPYWEMDATIAAHLARTPLTTLGLSSVTHTKTGAIDTKQTGYERITGPIGQQLISEAHDRGVAVQLVYTSFGTARNDGFLASTTVQDATIAALVKLTGKIGADGITVDIEQVRDDSIAAYGAFVGRLRAALLSAQPTAHVTAATAAGRTGAAMARAAVLAGADRIFLMGYDYHYAGSDVGASAPMDRRDGSDADLPWSLDLYAALEVPPEKTILGLPLYGMRWRVTGPELGASRLGNGAIWVPADNPAFLADPPAPPEFDPIEVVEFYAVAPTVSPVPGDSRATAGWQAIYVDSPATLTPKLTLADARGLAGAGCWAIGYERGLAGYRELMVSFTKGQLK